MVEVGSMQIAGSMDTSNIEGGLKRVEDGFKDVDRVGKGVSSDFERMGAQAKTLSKTFGVMALAGGGALVALAKGSPAVAGAMAKIEVGTMKLKFAIGSALKEEFNWFANKLNDVSGWVSENPDLFSGLTKGVTILAGAFLAFKVGSGIVAGFSALSGIVTSPIFLAALAAIGVAAAAWGFVSSISKRDQAYDALVPAGMKDIEYDAQTSGTTRQFVNDPNSNPYQVDLSIYPEFANYKNNQTNINQQTFAWDDLR